MAANYTEWFEPKTTTEKDIVARIEHELAVDATLHQDQKIHIYNIFKDAAHEIKSLRKQVHSTGPRLREGTTMKVRFAINQENKFLANCFINNLIDKAQSCPWDMLNAHVDVVIRIATPGIERIFPCIERHGGTVVNIKD
jgi:hypothetical protein